MMTVGLRCLRRVLPLALVIVGSSAAYAQFLRTTTQRDFDRGMAMYWGFDYAEAIRSFRLAASAEPDNPLSRLAIALSLGPSLNDRGMDARMKDAFAAAMTASELSKRQTGRVRDLADALSFRYTDAEKFDLSALNKAYSDRMRLVADKYPKDDDIQVLFAESLMLLTEVTAHTVHSVSSPDALTAVERVLARNPRHLGATHYQIHLLEGVDPKRALPSARRLDQMRPGAGHLLHMPSHITLRLGDYHAALASNVRAVAADRASAIRNNGNEPMMAAHSREFLATIACITGQSAVAREADDTIWTQLRFQRWADVLKTPEPKGVVGKLEWRVGRVLALVGTGRLSEAESAREDYAIYERTIPADAQWWADPVATALPMFQSEMDARIAWVRGDRASAIQHWKNAVLAQDRLTRLEAILPWFHPLRESLGAALYMNGNLAEAERIFREDLTFNSESGRSLFGLWKSLEAQKSRDAMAVERRFRAAWRNADVELTIENL